MGSKAVLWALALVVVTSGAPTVGSWLAPSVPAGTAAARPLPPRGFEFRTLKVGTKPEAVRRSAGLTSCRKWEDETSCRFERMTVGDIPMSELLATFDGTGFRSLIGSTASQRFEELAGQFREVYGEPCRSESRPLQNLMGAQFSGDVLTWCFPDGSLELARHDGSDVRRSSIFFAIPAKSEPRRSYDAATI